MTRYLFLCLVLCGTTPGFTAASDSATPVPVKFEAVLDPVEFGFRLDDNVFRTASSSGRLLDGVYLLNWGTSLNVRKDIFKVGGNYHLGVDQYQGYSQLNNIKNEFGLFASADPGELSFYYKYGLFLRSSRYPDFDYMDENNNLGVLWSPASPWTYEALYKIYCREYYSSAVSVQSQNFDDRGIFLSVQREIDEKFSLKLTASFDERQFNRYPVDNTGVPLSTLFLHLDETWTLGLNARLYFASVLQNITLERRRTNSNSYGFSNTAQSFSWAAVVNPVPPLYLQILFRFFDKEYDVAPLSAPGLQVGFTDEDSADILSVRGTWEWSSEWAVSLGASRIRNESTQPGNFYIKSILSAQARYSF